MWKPTTCTCKLFKACWIFILKSTLILYFLLELVFINYFIVTVKPTENKVNEKWKKWNKEVRIWVETAFLVGHGHAQTSQNDLEHGVLLDLLLYRLCIMTCVCDILYYSMFENVFRCNIITLTQERHALNGFVNHVSKSRNRDFCSRKSLEGRGAANDVF